MSRPDRKYPNRRPTHPNDAREYPDGAAPYPTVHAPLGPRYPASPGGVSSEAPASPRSLLDALAPEIARLAPTRATVLLVGPSRSACAEVANALHEQSGRERFVRVDCHALSDDAVERELFGGPVYELGGRGVVHGLERGTLYVAGIERLPILVQPRFLSFLDGCDRARVVASADAGEPATLGGLRRELAERLLLVTLNVPSD